MYFGIIIKAHMPYIFMKLILRINFRELGDLKELTDVLQNQFSSGAYTHHQKSVICDADPDVPGAARRLVAFVGGIFFFNFNFRKFGIL